MLEIAVKSTFMRQGLYAVLGLLAEQAGDIETASVILFRTMAETRDTGDRWVSVMCGARLARIAFLRGRLEEALGVCADAIHLATTEGDRPLPVIAFPLLAAAQVHLERNDLRRATEMFEAAREPSERWTNEARFEYLHVSALLSGAKGDLDAALDAERRGLELAAELPASEIERRVVESRIAGILIESQNTAQAITWAQNHRLARKARGGKSPLWRDLAQQEELTVFARLLLARGMPQKALEVTRLLVPAVRSRGLLRSLMELHVIRAVALDAVGKRKSALRVARELLALGERERAVRLFVDGGSRMHALLTEVGREQAYPAYVARILAAFPASKVKRIPAPPPESSGLSPRGAEILRLVAAGFSNKEISQRLSISLQTVKGHTSNIYSKLGVKNRVQAAAQARALGLAERL